MKKRVISAIIMLLIFIPVVYFGGIPLKIMFAILGLLGLKELLDLEKNIPVIMKVFSYFFALYFILYNHNDITLRYLLNYKVICGMFIFYFLGVILTNNQKKFNYRDAVYLIGSVLLIGIAFNGFIIVRNYGYAELFYLFLISSLTDSFALFSGKFFGKHKLAKKISPNKTIEGSIGGSILGPVIASIIYCALITNFDKFFYSLGFAFVLSIIGQCGDLFFSSIKRYYDIKDFSNIIPGHGGILDRLDSVIFVLLGYILILL